MNLFNKAYKEIKVKEEYKALINSFLLFYVSLYFRIICILIFIIIMYIF